MPLVRVPQLTAPFGYSLVEPPDSLVQEMFEYILNTSRWREDPDRLRKKVSLWRSELYQASKTAKKAPSVAPDAASGASPAQTLPEAPDDPYEALKHVEPEWLRDACLIRAHEKLGWKAIAARVGKSKTTVQNTLPEVFARLKLDMPVAIGTVMSDRTVLK